MILTSVPAVGALAEDCVNLARGQGLTLATAESLTAGMVAAALATVPGASAVLRGGVVSYHREVKESLLGVDPDLLSRVGAVDPEVARQMADGARRACGAGVGISTTGVAGPETHDGKEVGAVVVAVAALQGGLVREHYFAGDRAEIRQAACDAALQALKDVLTGIGTGTNGALQ